MVHGLSNSLVHLPSLCQKSWKSVTNASHSSMVTDTMVGNLTGYLPYPRESLSPTVSKTDIHCRCVCLFRRVKVSYRLAYSMMFGTGDV